MTKGMTRQQFYLPDPLARKLGQIVQEENTCKTAILTEALEHWFDSRRTKELDTRFGPVVQKLVRGFRRIESKLDLLIEMVGLFVHFSLTASAHDGEFDESAKLRGRERFERFLAQAGSGGLASRIANLTGD